MLENAEAICRKIVAFVDDLPEADEGFTVMLALAWALGGQIAAVPDGYRSRSLDVAWTAVRDVAARLEERGMAGTGFMMLEH